MVTSNNWILFFLISKNLFPYRSLILFDCDIDLGNLYFMLQLLNRYCWIGQAAPNNTPLWSERGVLAVKGRYPQMYVSTVKYYCKVYNSMTQSKKLIKAIVLGTKSDPSSDWVVTDHSSVHLLWSVLGYWTSPTLWIKLNYDKYLNYVSCTYKSDLRLSIDFLL